MLKAADIILGMCDERTKVIPGHGDKRDKRDELDSGTIL
jgi:hypothetical protein